MRLVHLSDLHIDSSKEVIYGVNPVHNLQLAVEKLKSIPDIDVIVVTGDITNDGMKESYLKADSVLSALNRPVYVVLGNHDNQENFDAIKDSLTALKFTDCLTVKGYRILFLNSVITEAEGKNHSSGAFYEYTLFEQGPEGVKDILVMHHPAIEVGGWMNRRILINRDEFRKRVSESRRVAAVLSGHNHHHFSREENGVLFTVGTSTSTTFSPEAKPFEEVYAPGLDILEFSYSPAIGKTSIEQRTCLFQKDTF